MPEQNPERWSLSRLHHKMMEAGMCGAERLALLAEQDEHLGNLETLREDAARVGYRLNAVAPANPDVDLRYPGMEEIFRLLTETSERRWAEINENGRLEDPGLWGL